MSMSVRDRILAVFRGETPDVVPFMVDLEHWFCHRTDKPFDSRYLPAEFFLSL